MVRSQIQVRRFWLTLIVASIALVALVVGGRPAAVSAQSQAVSVAIQNFSFQSANIQVAAGTTVTWTNNDSVAHTVTSDDGSFDSGQIQPGASFSHTFNTPGTVSYHCSDHPYMTAQVVVMAAGTSSQAATAAGTSDQAMTTPAAVSAASSGTAVVAAPSAPNTLPNTGAGTPSSGHGSRLFILLGAAVALLALTAATLTRRGVSRRHGR